MLRETAWIEPLGWMLVHSVWLIGLVSGVAAVTLLALRRRSAEARYWVGMLALALSAAALPAAFVWELAHRQQLSESVAVPFVETRTEVAIDEALLPVAVEQVASVRPAQHAIDLPPAMSSLPVAETTTSESEARSRWERIQARLRPQLPLLVGGWLIGVGLLSLRPLIGWRSSRRLKTMGLLEVNASLKALLRRLVDRLGVRAAVRVFESSLVQVPCVVGVLKPVILLPLSAINGLTIEQLEAVLAHELAHVRRHDLFFNVLQTLIETLLFYHPAIWWLSRRVRQEREHCCDDLAISVCGDAANYARMLVSVESLRASVPQAALAASGGSLVTRIRRLLPPTQEPNRSPWLVLGVAVLTCALLVSAAQSWSLVGDQEAGEVTDARGKNEDVVVAAAKSSDPVEVADPEPPQSQNNKQDAAAAERGRVFDFSELAGSESDPQSDPNSRQFRKTEHPTPLRDAQQFSEATEVVLSMGSLKYMLDLDGGQTMDPPQTYRVQQKKMDVCPLDAPSTEVPAGLQGMSLRGLRVKPDDWSAEAAQVQKQLANEKVGALTKLPFDKSEKATYFFRTADGAEGVLQLLEQTDDPKGIRLRYKRLVGSKLNGQIKVGITFDEVIAIKGRHYRLSHGMKADQIILVYDDIAIAVDSPPNAKNGGKVAGFEPGLPREVVQNVPYADEEVPPQNQPRSKAGATRSQAPPGNASPEALPQAPAGAAPQKVDSAKKELEAEPQRARPQAESENEKQSLTVVVKSEEDGRVLAGAEVTLGWGTSPIVKTNERGEAIFEHASGSQFPVRVRAAGHRVELQRFNVTGSSQRRIEMKVARGGVVLGMAKNEKGEPLGGGAVISVLSSDNKPLPGVKVQSVYAVSGEAPTFVTDAEGQVRIDKLQLRADGVAMLQFDHPDHVRLVRDVKPGTDEMPSHVSVSLERGHRAVVRVTDTSGKPIPGADVRFGNGMTLQSDAQGRVTTTRAPSFDSSHIIKALGHVPQEVYVNWDKRSEVTVALQEAGELRGDVVDARTGLSIRAFHLRVGHSLKEDRSQWSAAWPEYGIRSEYGPHGETNFATDNGRFHLNGSPLGCRHALRVSADGYVSQLLPDVAAADRRTKERITIKLQPVDPQRVIEITGQLLEATGQPIGNVNVTVLGRHPSHAQEDVLAKYRSGQIEWNSECVLVKSVVTDKQGRFRLGRVSTQYVLDLVYQRHDLRPQLVSAIHQRPLAELTDLRLKDAGEGTIEVDWDRKAFRIEYFSVSPANPNLGGRQEVRVHDADSMAYFRDLPPGLVNVTMVARDTTDTAGKSETITQTLPVTVKKGEVARVKFARP